MKTTRSKIDDLAMLDWIRDVPKWIHVGYDEANHSITLWAYIYDVSQTKSVSFRATKGSKACKDAVSVLVGEIFSVRFPDQLPSLLLAKAASASFLQDALTDQEKVAYAFLETNMPGFALPTRQEELFLDR
jgi:hypothetical protein